ncbi:hypothetical protein EDB92DRAFT_1805583, partial [Lactarius akahatsu]
LTLLEIVRSQLPTAEFAFLSADHIAELTKDRIVDEGPHLAVAIQFCRFRSVIIGTMWAMADTDGVDLSKYFYKYIFSELRLERRATLREICDGASVCGGEKLQRRGVTLERWVNCCSLRRMIARRE